MVRTGVDVIRNELVDDLIASERLLEPVVVSEAEPAQKYSAEWIAWLVQKNSYTTLLHHTCSGCQEWTMYHFDKGRVFYDRSCGCGQAHSRPDPSSYEDIAEWFAMQDDAGREKILTQFRPSPDQRVVMGVDFAGGEDMTVVQMIDTSGLHLHNVFVPELNMLPSNPLAVMAASDRLEAAERAAGVRTVTIHQINIGMQMVDYVTRVHPTWYAFVRDADDSTNYAPGDHVEFILNGEVVQSGRIVSLIPPGEVHDPENGGETFKDWMKIVFEPDKRGA